MGNSSVTRYLTREFTEQWKLANPGAKIISRDLTVSGLKPVDAEWVGAAYTPPPARTPEQKQALALSDTLVAELMEADEYVIGVPMWNFGVPSLVKAWIDQIARAGVTFAYVDGAPKGLIVGKKATFLIAAGGSYDAGTATEGLNFVEPYLKTVFGFLGLTDITFHTAGGAAALMRGADRADFFAPHENAIKALVSA
jgi:FMN-dependent NADH-azoreductase